MSLHRNQKPSTLSIENPDNDDAAEETLEEAIVHSGVLQVEAASKVYGRNSRVALFVGLGLAAYIYSLDNQTTSAYLAFAASDFGDHSLISSIQTAQSIILACGKPVIAKLADISSRGTAYVVVLLFHVTGYIIIASAQNIDTVAAGVILFAIGLQLLMQIIIADITTLEWRGLINGLLAIPFIVNSFIGPNIATAVLETVGWRWGYGMFVILVPICLSPLIITITWAERKAQRLGLSPVKEISPKSLLERARIMAEELDLLGLVLITACIALILLPLTLTGTVNGGWSNPSMILLIALGGVLLPICGVWDVCYAKYPVIPPRFFKNRSVIIVSLIGAFDFCSYFLTAVYLYSFIIVVKPWSLLYATYFSQIQSMALTIFAILAGVIMKYTHRYKALLIIGLFIRLVGIVLMIRSRGAKGSDAELIWTQVLQGLGGGFAASCSQVGAQASVPHIDLAMATAIILLVTEIGASIGGSVGGAIWSSKMPRKLAQYLPDLSEKERAALFSSITDVTKYERGTHIREGVILAYSDVMKDLLVLASILSIFPLFLAILLPNWYLGDKQNAVNDEDLVEDLGRRFSRGQTRGEYARLARGEDEVVADHNADDSRGESVEQEEGEC
ncbi:drug:h+ antiporter [Lentinula detonsa]|uniref:Drug:h+ antiporter n=1 Tax=Lentinula detonsa TaxID=2804962 RepID=A0AA38PR61_9AGAR|nr:drug:h+ antiporter [Lentinula detonsa]